MFVTLDMYAPFGVHVAKAGIFRIKLNYIFSAKKKKESRVELRQWCSISESRISSPFYVQCFIY